MAYKADLGVKTVHGTNPQNLIEHIVRERIFASVFWKEECFGLNAAALAKRAMDLTYVGGTWGGARRPTPFLCLLLKMLMIQPEMEIVEAFISEKDFRYVRLLGVFYLRLVGSGEEIYKCLESIYSDNRKFKMRQLDGSFTIEYIDDFVDKLLTTPRVCDTTLPPLVQRKVLKDRKVLGKRVSMLDDLLKEEEQSDESDQQREKETEYSSEEEERNRHVQRKTRYLEEEDESRGRRSERRGNRSASPSPDRASSSKRTGFRSPSPQGADTRRRAERSPDARESGRASKQSSERSPSRTGSKSPQVGGSPRATRSPQLDRYDRRRGERSPDASESRLSRGARSPDATSRRADRSPDVSSVNRRSERSPDAPSSRRAERSPDSRRSSENRSAARYPYDSSPRRQYDRRSPSPESGRYRRDDRSPRRRQSPERGRDARVQHSSYRDDRYYEETRDSRYDRDFKDRRDQRERYDVDSSRKRSRNYDEDDDFDHHPKRPKYAQSSRESSGRESTYKAPGSGKAGGKGGGGLREMSTGEMNELRKSIGLGPLKS